MRLTAVVWRDDGVINYIIPPETLIHTFMATVSPHDKWICHLINDFGYAISPELFEKHIHALAGPIATQMKESLAKHHGIEELPEGRCHEGTDGTFDGMFYGTMHPTELSVLSDSIEEAIEIVKEFSSAAEEDMQRTFTHAQVWIEAAKKFVRPSERMGSILGEIGYA